MIAGASIPYWIGFHVLVAVLLIVDLAVLHRGSHSTKMRNAWAWTIFLATLACGFALFLSKTQGRQPGLEFFSGYLIEGSLSVDNLFVFLLMFRSLRLDAEEQHRVLLWGILGAIVMRAVFIAVGVSLLNRFAWVEYVFGTFLLVAAIRLLRHKPGDDSSPGLMSWLQRRCLRGVHDSGEAGIKLGMPAFFFVILAVEATDLVFALDSIPAVLAITRDPFIVYTSNIFAILGLRSLYFVLAGMLDKLRLLHYGLAVILAFVALKMLLAHWIEVPVSISLAVILITLLIFAIASKLIPEKRQI
ncbi:TerC/Alx family metal homeostasis membrane protein [Alloacidobacterium sp.]|uniref:TerC/Alx family metal homeostasis membrane protein n=1 Tax=Alloacidobacterium sp. TaxID=2951999 RepID=UPI002D6D7D7F|nr:TerC/Alx family metal homeostasis membrane protein [Alloacidobacterium sp.]HYK34382.1 TerC/Alx family metal homeostasis membrane protein [Alloacidobacterium sp.]